MMILIRDIKGLVQVEDIPKERICGKDMSVLNSITDAYLLIDSGIIKDFGSMRDLPLKTEKRSGKEFRIIDANGKYVFPSFCDPHTHIVYAGSREAEFADRIRGLSYEEIARRGGGILNSAKLLHATSENDLFLQSMERINEIIFQGTGAVEIKSGYGLNTEDEIKMLRVIKRIRQSSPLEVRSTFLGAHTIPIEYKGRREEYIDVIINEMIPVVASEQLADFIDVFCDTGFFTVEETEQILMAGL